MGKRHHVIEARQFDREMLEGELFPLADEMKILAARGGASILSRRIMASLFYQPSTRTRLSFESAMYRLGGEVISTENAKEFSSTIKGESLEDTIRVVGAFAHVIVLRHPADDAAIRAAEVSRVPVINAGSGTDQHPTQALLDLYTIKKELGHIDSISIALVGDLLRGRTVRSLAYLLAKFRNIRIVFVYGEGMAVHEGILEHLTEHGVPFSHTHDLARIASEVDVIYMTRFQKEWIADNAASLQAAYDTTLFTEEVAQRLPAHAIVLHPLPRNQEIYEAFDSDPRAAYFRQSDNGVPIRMALLRTVIA